jgi:hypothetical protein
MFIELVTSIKMIWIYLFLEEVHPFAFYNNFYFITTEIYAHCKKKIENADKIKFTFASKDLICLN